jgi:hypothetical protein
MVPFALNANRIPPNQAGDFFRKVIEEKKWPQGIWVVSPEGKILAFHYFRPKADEKMAEWKARWSRETREAVEAGLKAFGPVAERPPLPAADPLPERGCGCTKEGGTRLAVYVIAMRNGRKEGDPVVDSVILSEKEWHAFLPEKVAQGVEWTVPEEVAKRFSPVLSPMTDSIYTPQPKDVQVATLKAVIDKMDGGIARVRLTGSWEATHYREEDAKLPVRTAATAEGVMFLDVGGKSVRSLLLVFKGTYRNIPPYDKTTQPTAGVVEWAEKK